MCLQLEPWYACNEVFRFLTAPKIKGQNSPWLAKLLFLVKVGFMVAQDHEHELSMHMLQLIFFISGPFFSFVNLFGSPSHLTTNHKQTLKRRCLASQKILQLYRSWDMFVCRRVFQFGFFPSKPCFSPKSVPLNSCYYKANPQKIGSFPANVTRWVKDWFQLHTSIGR